MLFSTKDIDLTEYKEEHKTKYYKAFDYALKEWTTLCSRAVHYYKGQNTISVAEQLQAYCHIPYEVAKDIAQTISISKAVGL